MQMLVSKKYAYEDVTTQMSGSGILWLYSMFALLRLFLGGGGGLTKLKYKSIESRLFDLSTVLDVPVGPPGSS